MSHDEWMITPVDEMMGLVCDAVDQWYHGKTVLIGLFKRCEWFIKTFTCLECSHNFVPVHHRHAPVITFN